jgi:cytochrome c553
MHFEIRGRSLNLKAPIMATFFLRLLQIMLAKSPRSLHVAILMCSFGYAIGGTTSTEEAVTTGGDELVGNIDAGAERYKKSCINCHGPAGKGVASYPKISGQEISYTKSTLETYRDGIKIGPNSSLMIMMAKPLTDQEIADLAAYLKDASV